MRNFHFFGLSYLFSTIIIASFKCMSWNRLFRQLFASSVMVLKSPLWAYLFYQIIRRKDETQNVFEWMERKITRHCMRHTKWCNIHPRKKWLECWVNFENFSVKTRRFFFNDGIKLTKSPKIGEAFTFVNSAECPKLINQIPLPRKVVSRVFF